jgi:hypothetical protein
MVEGLLLLVGTSLAGAIGNQVNPISLLNIQSGVYTLAGLFALATLERVAQVHRREVSPEQVVEPISGG